MKPASLFLKATLASVAYAQLDTIQQAIGAVSDALGQLDTKVKAISGNDINSAAPVLQASQKIQTTMQASTAKVNGAQALGVFDALSLQDTANSLVASVNQTMADLTAKKQILDSFGVTQVAVQSIQDQKTASKALGDAIVSKVPSVGQGIAQSSISQINSALDRGIKALSTGAGTSGGKGGGDVTGGGSGSGRNSSSNGNSGISGGRTGGRNSTSSNGSGAGFALNPARPADADGPSMSSARSPDMMGSSTAAMPSGMPGMNMPGGMMSTPAAAMPEISSATTTMAGTTMMTGSAQSSSMKAGNGAASMGSPAAALIGGLGLLAVIGVF